MPDFKIPITTDELSNNDSKGFSIEQQDFFIVKKFDQLHIYRNQCPHRNLPLHWQPDVFLNVEKELIQCSVHGALFSIQDGLCIAGPCVKQNLKKIPHYCDSINIFISI